MLIRQEIIPRREFYFMQIKIIFALADRISGFCEKSSSSSFNQCRFNSL